MSIQTVQIFDNNILRGTVQSLADGRWTFPTPVLTQGIHVFTARASGVTSNLWSINIQDEQLNLLVPHFENSRLVGPNREEIDYYQQEGDGFVQVQVSTLRPGDTVGVSWVGRRVTYNSEIQTVSNPPVPMRFKISQYEIIDCIGENAAISYTVVRPPSTTPITSPTLNLTIQGNRFAIEAPTLSTSHDNLRVWKQGQFNNNSTARVRAIGISTWQSDIEYFNNQPYLNFTINPALIAENRGRPVLFNYSLKINPGDSIIYYSQILRVDRL